MSEFTIKSIRNNEPFEGYQSTDFIVKFQSSIILKIEQGSCGVMNVSKDVNVSCAAFMTAWKRLTQLIAQEDKIKNQNLVIKQINKARLWLIGGIGQDPSYKWFGRSSLLVLGKPRHEAIRLGAVFALSAIVCASKSGVLELVPCPNGLGSYS